MPNLNCPERAALPWRVSCDADLRARFENGLYSFGQASEHKTNHTNANHRFTMIYSNFIVAAQAPGFKEPAKGSLHQPAFRQNFKTLGSITPSDDLQFQFAIGTQLFDPRNQLSQIAAIGPDDLQSAKEVHQSLDQRFGGVSILHGGAGNHQAQDQTQRVHRQMALAALDLLARVIAAFSRLIRCFDRLAVHNGRRRRDVAPFGFPEPISQRVVNENPRPILAPLSVIAIDGLPIGKIARQKSPSAARSHHIEDRVDHTSTIVLDGPPTFSLSRLGSRHERLDVIPFIVSKVRWITSRMRLHPVHL